MSISPFCLTEPLPDYLTLVDCLHQRALKQPQQLAFTFLQDGEVATDRLTYQALDRRSRSIAAALQSRHLVGERAILLYPPGLDYITAFFGCLYAGVVAVPAYPPRNQRNTPRILAMMQDASAAIALTTTTMLAKTQSLLDAKTNLSHLHWLTTDDLSPDLADDWQMPASQPDAIAFLQYTSGSTGTPKGVMLSHGNLLHNAAVTYQVMEHSPDRVFVSWLPAYHDMGLIGGILQPLYGGFPCVLMAPASFLQRPYRWLKAIAEYGGTTSGGPNFAYELCVQKITPEQRATLDLSCWDVAFNGAEPIRAETLEQFSNYFADCGFRAQAFYPCYGMAEASLIVSGGHKADLPTLKSVAKTLLEQHPIVAETDSPASQTLVGCGHNLPDQQIVIVHPETRVRCRSGEVGEVWIAGPSVGQGYWQRTEETAQTFQAYLADSGEGPFLRSGDLGFLDKGELFITGRAKDVMIIRGRNLYPQDIEHTVERSHPALRPTCSAAFAVSVKGEEQLVVVQELEFRQQPNLESVVAAIRQAVAEIHEVQPYGIVLIKPGTIPKTSSGKIQRRACRDNLLAGELSIQASSILNSARTVQVRPNLSTLYVAPSNEIEQKLADLWQDVLQLEQVGMHDNFFELGGDSLRMVQVCSQLQLVCDREFTIVDLFEYPTIHALATLIRQEQSPLDFQPMYHRTEKQKGAIQKRRQRQQREGVSHG